MMFKIFLITILLGPIFALFGSYWGWLGVLIGFLIPFAAALGDYHLEKKHPSIYNFFAYSGSHRSKDEKHIQVMIGGKKYSGHITRDD